MVTIKQEYNKDQITILRENKQYMRITNFQYTKGTDFN